MLDSTAEWWRKTNADLSQISKNSISEPQSRNLGQEGRISLLCFILNKERHFHSSPFEAEALQADPSSPWLCSRAPVVATTPILWILPSWSWWLCHRTGRAPRGWKRGPAALCLERPAWRLSALCLSYQQMHWWTTTRWFTGNGVFSRMEK